MLLQMHLIVEEIYFYSEIIFQQTIETLNFINEKIKSQKVLWILRPHPTSIIEYGEEGISERNGK